MPPQQTPYPAAGLTVARPRLSGTTLGMFAMVVLIWLLSLVVVAMPAIGAALVAGWRPPVAVALACGLWTVSCVLVLTRPVEALLARLLFHGVHRPDPTDLARIGRALQAVCRRAGADPGRYLLRIQESSQVNGFALGGHTLAVTRVALQLPDPMLEAVVAHEVGHHRHLHPLAIILGWWFLLPFEAAERLQRAIRRVTRGLARAYARLRDQTAGARAADGAIGMVVLLALLGALVVTGTLLVVALGLLWLPLWLLVRLARVLGAGLSRAGEYAADRHAVELGYGPGLVWVLERFALAERSTPRPHGLAALLRSHPTSQARLLAVGRAGPLPP
jgi:Zn-dependent protease with chaperone function